MSFSFDEALADDVSLVRFHIGDTETDGHFLADETISYWLTASGSVGTTVVRCIEYIITQLSVPNFRLDWMRVDNEAARKGYENMLKTKKQELGVTSGSTSVAYMELPSRADSDQEDNTYDGAP